MKNVTIVALAMVLLAVCIYDVAARPGDGGKGKDHNDFGKDDGKDGDKKDDGNKDGGKKDDGSKGHGKNDGKGKSDDSSSSSSESDEHNGKGKNDKGGKKWWR